MNVNAAMQTTTTSRRGIAMLMVMICLAVATVITAAALSTQDSSPIIGDNAAQAAASHWSAQSAADIAVAVIEQKADWAEDGSTLMENMNIAGGDVKVTVTDLEGNPTTADAREVLVTATSVVNGIESTIQKVVTIAPKGSISEAIDPDLGEFGIYVTESLQMEDSATITRWPLSPESTGTKGVPVGLGFSSSYSFEVGDDAHLGDAQIVTDTHCSSSLKSTVADVVGSGTMDIPLPVPAVAEVFPADFNSLASTDQTLLAKTGSNTFSVPAGHHRELRVTANGVAEISQANGRWYWFTNAVRIDAGGTLVVRGNVRIATTDLLMSERGSIEFADDSSTLTVYFNGKVTIDNSTIGLPRAVSANNSRTSASITTYINPKRMRLIQWYGAGAPAFTLDHRSLVCAVVHAPNTPASFADRSSLLGRITASSLRIDSSSSLLYCPRLDNRMGFTTRNGPLYQADGAPIAGLVTALTDYKPALGSQLLPTTIQNAVTTAEATNPSDSLSQTAGNVATEVKTTTTAVANNAWRLEGWARWWMWWQH